MSETWPQWMIHAQDVGLIGPASLRFHHDHAQGFTEAPELKEGASADGTPNGRSIDLGSGGGLPGLVLAGLWPTSHWLLLDARKRSEEHLEDAIAAEGLKDRVEMVTGRAEDLGRDDSLRELFVFATARGFAKPGITAELAASFLCVGGVLVVSEPPEDIDRWPKDGLTMVGLEPGSSWANDVGHYRSFRKVDPLGERYPRRVGIPEKRPLF